MGPRLPPDSHAHCPAGARTPGGDSLIPWRSKCKPIPVFLPGEAHGQRSLVGYSSWCHKESDMTERLSTAQNKVTPNLHNRASRTHQTLDLQISEILLWQRNLWQNAPAMHRSVCWASISIINWSWLKGTLLWRDSYSPTIGPWGIHLFTK